MLKILKWGAISLLALAMIIKLSLWWSVRLVMDDAIKQLPPFLNISYGGITSSLDGRVGLEDLRLHFPSMDDGLQVKHAELKFNGLRELLRFRKRMAEGKFPEQMAVRLQGVTLDVHGPLMQQLYAAPVERSALIALGEVACGPVRFIGTGELLDMGYRTVEMDAELSYLFQPQAQKLALSFTSSTRDMGQMRFTLSLANMSEKPDELKANRPRLSSVVLELHDNQYQRKVQHYCASKLGQSVEAYQQTAAGQFDAVLRRQGIALGQSLLDAYARYLKDPRSLRVELLPTDGVEWEGLQFFEAKDVVAMLRPAILVNEEVVQPIEFAWVGVGEARNEPTGLEKISVVNDNSQLQRASPRYEFVEVSDLQSYAGKRLQFITFDGTYYQGVLHKVENGKAYLSVQFGSGSAEMFLRLEKIAKVRVRF